jgi:hypothetical protein
LNELRTGDSVTYRGRRYVVFDTSPPSVVLRDLQRQVFVNAAPDEIRMEPIPRRRVWRRALRRLLDGRGRNLV